VDLRVCGVSAFGQADNSRAAFVGCVGPDDIPDNSKLSLRKDTQ
jgi:hypothetical protein